MDRTPDDSLERPSPLDARLNRKRPPASSGRLAARRMAVVAAMAATVAIAGTAWFLAASAQRRAIEDMPGAGRRALYERTLQTLRTSCQGRQDDNGLADYCRRQAEFVVLFPDCDAACFAAAEPFRGRPTR